MTSFRDVSAHGLRLAADALRVVASDDPQNELGRVAAVLAAEADRRRQTVAGREKWAAEYEAGASLRQIADRHRCSVSLVQRHLRMLGVPRRSRGAGMSRRAGEDRQDWVKAYLDGSTLEDVAAAANRSVSTIHRHLLSVGVVMRPVGRPLGLDAPAWAADALALREQGVLPPTIALNLGVTTYAVNQLFRRACDEAEAA